MYGKAGIEDHITYVVSLSALVHQIRYEPVMIA